jgi:hypothetical protein
VSDEDRVFLRRPRPPLEPQLLAARRPPHCCCSVLLGQLNHWYSASDG